VFGTEGPISRMEYFPADHEAEALARFDELTSETGPFAPPGEAPTKPLPRVRANAATAHAARVEAAIAARDADAFLAMYADESETVDHTTGATSGRQGLLGSLRALLKAENSTLVREMLATLGNSLALWRNQMSASGLAGGTFDVGPYEREELVLCYVDAQGRHRRSEIFAPDHLGEAIVRLYERYAELLPDGPARTRAAGIARSVGPTLRPFGVDSYAETLDPAIEVVDHRIRGTWSARGAEEVLRHMRAWFDLAEDSTVRYDDVLALQPDAFVVSPIICGTGRASGGTAEVALLALVMFGADGRHARIEWFDRDRTDDALARFDELTSAAGPFAPPAGASKKPMRRVRANAASEHLARVAAAMVARDADALPALIVEGFEWFDHTTGVALDQQGGLSSLRWFLRAENPTLVHEMLATLGDSLALGRVSTSATGFAGGKLDIGAYEKDELVLCEVDAQGRGRRGETFAPDHLGGMFDVGPYEREELILCDVDAQGRGRRGETFAPDHLGDAIVRLYERYA